MNPSLLWSDIYIYTHTVKPWYLELDGTEKFIWDIQDNKGKKLEL